MNIKRSIAGLTVIQFALMGISALLLYRSRIPLGAGLIPVSYSISLPAFLLCAVIFVAGILSFDFFYFSIWKRLSKRTFFILYFILIYIIRIGVSFLFVDQVFEFYSIQTAGVQVVDVAKIVFWGIPLISPAITGLLQLTHSSCLP